MKTMRLLVVFSPTCNLICDQAEKNRDRHIRQGISHRCIHLHQEAVYDKSDQPDDKVFPDK